MTDEQIIEALECCSQDGVCENCPANGICDNDGFIGAILGLIKRQQAEIESLEADYENVYKQAAADLLASITDGGTSCEWCIDEHRAEAIKEFAERLKDVFVTIDGTFECWEIEEHIDELVKEMTEKEGGKG